MNSSPLSVPLEYQGHEFVDADALCIFTAWLCCLTLCKAKIFLYSETLVANCAFFLLCHNDATVLVAKLLSAVCRDIGVHPSALEVKGHYST